MLMDFLGVLSPAPALSRASLLSRDRKLRQYYVIMDKFSQCAHLLCRVVQPEGAVEAPGKVTPCDLGSCNSIIIIIRYQDEETADWRNRNGTGYTSHKSQARFREEI